MRDKCCLGSRKLSQKEANKWMSECCGTEDVSASGSKKTQEFLKNCCGQHSKLSEREKVNERVQSGNCLCK